MISANDLPVQRVHVRSLYDCDTVLRRLAGALRALSADEAAASTERFPASGPPDPTAAAPQPLAGRAAHVGALRRSRELLDALQRAITHRHAGAITPNGAMSKLQESQKL